VEIPISGKKSYLEWQFHSIRTNKQWRMIFRWEGQDALDVQIIDYGVIFSDVYSICCVSQQSVHVASSRIHS
jgi:hypothetical protein